jgi:transposase
MPHLQGLYKLRIATTGNAAAEAFNSYMQMIKANARRFRRFQGYCIRMLLYCGKLKILPIV